MFLFKQRDSQIQKHNQNHKNTWKKAHNQFSCLTDEQFRDMYLTAKPPKRQKKLAYNHEEDITISRRKNLQSSEEDESYVKVKSPHVKDFPALNWNTRGKVSPVKEQGNCGSCWTFSTTGAIEAAYLIK